MFIHVGHGHYRLMTIDAVQPSYGYGALLSVLSRFSPDRSFSTTSPTKVRLLRTSAPEAYSHPGAILLQRVSLVTVCFCFVHVLLFTVKWMQHVNGHFMERIFFLKICRQSFAHTM